MSILRKNGKNVRFFPFHLKGDSKFTAQSGPVCSAGLCSFWQAGNFPGTAWKSGFACGLPCCFWGLCLCGCIWGIPPKALTQTWIPLNPGLTGQFRGLWADLCEDIFLDYPPGYLYVLVFLEKLRLLLGLPMESQAYSLLIKMPSILADLFCGGAVLLLAQRKLGEKSALLLSGPTSSARRCF